MARRLLSLWFPERPETWLDGPAELEKLAAWCQQYSPLTASDPPDGVMIDITGCAHLFGGEVLLRAHILARLPKARLATARLAVAGTAAAAWALARYGEVADSEDLTALPLAALNLAPRTIIRLRRVGVRRIGELARLPRAELTAGFGAEPVLKLQRALGQAPEVLRFFKPPPEWRAVLHYAEPIFAPAQLQAALTQLAETLCHRLAAGGQGATLLTARFHRIDSNLPEFGLRFAAPCRDSFEIAKLCREKLQLIDPGFGVEAISLEAGMTEALAPMQMRAQSLEVGSLEPAENVNRPLKNIFNIASGAADYTRPVNTLLNRLGENIWRTAPHDSHIPEFAARKIPVTTPPALWRKPRHKRPVTLLRRPDEITAIAPVPDDPPVQFSWRGENHRVARATGPERIAREWWQGEQVSRPEAERIRDYYEVEDTTGARFWLFRAGTHGGVAPVRWFLHGFFG